MPGVSPEYQSCLAAILRPTAEDSSHNTAANTPKTPSTPATRSGLPSSEISPATRIVDSDVHCETVHWEKMQERHSLLSPPGSDTAEISNPRRVLLRTPPAEEPRWRKEYHRRKDELRLKDQRLVDGVKPERRRHSFSTTGGSMLSSTPPRGRDLITDATREAPRGLTTYYHAVVTRFEHLTFSRASLHAPQRPSSVDKKAIARTASSPAAYSLARRSDRRASLRLSSLPTRVPPSSPTPSSSLHGASASSKNAAPRSTSPKPVPPTSSPKKLPAPPTTDSAAYCASIATDAPDARDLSARRLASPAAPASRRTGDVRAVARRGSLDRQNLSLSGAYTGVLAWTDQRESS